MKKPLSVAKLKKQADKFFSLLIRTELAEKTDQNGFVSCYTCLVKKFWKEMQAGHYESRTHNATRFSRKNVKVQCVACNIFKDGNKPVFALNLIKEYGEGILGELRKQARKAKQFTTKELKQMIEEYKK